LKFDVSCVASIYSKQTKEAYSSKITENLRTDKFTIFRAYLEKKIYCFP